MKQVIYLLLFYCSLNAQESRLKTVDESGRQMTTIYPSESMCFVLTSGDTIFVNVALDSINEAEKHYSIYSFFQNVSVIDNYSLVVVFESNVSMALAPTFSDWKESYFEYRLTSEQVLRLRTSPIRGLLFESASDIVSCVTLVNQQFFTNFLNKYIR
jgi:hypothetical protein